MYENRLSIKGKNLLNTLREREKKTTKTASVCVETGGELSNQGSGHSEVAETSELTQYSHCRRTQIFLLNKSSQKLIGRVVFIQVTICTPERV